MINEVIFDIESQRLFSEVEGNEPSKLGVSIVSLYTRQVSDDQTEISGEMKSFWEHELDAMWPYFANAQRIIGFNTIKFDVPVLLPYAPENFSKLPHFDMMTTVRNKLGHYLSLSTLAKYTIGKDKTDVGTNAVMYWKNHDEESMRKLKQYCQDDVMITKELYDYGVQNKQLKYMDNWNTVQSFEVDFSYPKEILDASRQIGMF